MAVKKKFPYRSALVACNGGCHGEQDGAGGCAYGCIGCGACVSVCPFNAIALNEKGVAQVDENLCIACGKCVRECPRQLIRIHETANYIVVRCANKDRGAEARKVCEVSCIGCGLCERVCPAEAIHVQDNCAVIDEELCLSCGMCAVKCPRHVLGDLRGILA